MSIDVSKKAKAKSKIKKMTKIIRKLNKNSGYSYSINIPKEIIDKYNWKAKQKLTIEDKGRGALVIKDWRKS